MLVRTVGQGEVPRARHSGVFNFKRIELLDLVKEVGGDASDPAWSALPDDIVDHTIDFLRQRIDSLKEEQNTHRKFAANNDVLQDALEKEEDLLRSTARQAEIDGNTHDARHLQYREELKKLMQEGEILRQRGCKIRNKQEKHEKDLRVVEREIQFLRTHFK